MKHITSSSLLNVVVSMREGSMGDDISHVLLFAGIGSSGMRLGLRQLPESLSSPAGLASAASGSGGIPAPAPPRSAWVWRMGLAPRNSSGRCQTQAHRSSSSLSFSPFSSTALPLSFDASTVCAACWPALRPGGGAARARRCIRLRGRRPGLVRIHSLDTLPPAPHRLPRTSPARRRRCVPLSSADTSDRPRRIRL